MEGIGRTSRVSRVKLLRALFVTVVITLFTCMIVSVSAAPNDHILINSKDWKDVYSGILFAKTINKNSNFLVSDRHALIYEETLDKTRDYVLIEGDNNYFSGFEDTLTTSGYSVERISEDNNNLVLAQRAVDEEGISNFIVIDGAQGYLAVAAASYAVVSNSFVLFSDADTIGDVSDFLSNNQVDNVLVVGYVTRDVQDAIAQYNPEYLEGQSRFEANIELVKRYREINPMTQVIITNGEFIEDEVMSGLEPVVFIGKQAIPDVVKEYFQGSNIKVAVLIGNELVNTATQIKRELGVTTFVKFARTARVPSGAMSQIEGLDLFYLPVFEVSLQVADMQYNEITDLIELTLENTGELGLYERTTLTVPLANGEELSLGDSESQFIEAGASRTFTYEVEGEIALEGKTKLFTVFGEAPASLEKTLYYDDFLDVIQILDDSVLEIKEVSYSKKDNAFAVMVENTGEVDAFAIAELVDLLVEEFETTVGSKRTVAIDVGETKPIWIRQRMGNLDLEDNPEVFARVYYGQRESGLYKETSGTFDLLVDEYNYILIAVVAVVIIALLWFIVAKRRRKKKRPQGHFHMHNHNQKHF